MPRNVVLIAILIAGCAPIPGPSVAHGGARWPTQPKVRTVQEGPFARATILQASHGQIGYELARFELPNKLTRDQQRRAIDEVERGLRTRAAGEVERGTFPLDGVVATILSMDLPDGKRGRWVIGFVGDDTMIQISTIGVDDARTRTKSAAFFQSFGTVNASTSASATK